MTKRFLVGLMGPNRPGILAAVSNAISELGGDIQESRQVTLQGCFTMLLAVDFPLHRDPQVIDGHIRGVCNAFDADVAIKDPEQDVWEDEPREAQRYYLTLTGPNTPGLVSLLSARLAREQIDVSDSYGRRTEEIFSMSLELRIPRGVDAAVLQGDLQNLATPSGLTITLQSDAEARPADLPPALCASPVKPQP